MSDEKEPWYPRQAAAFVQALALRYPMKDLLECADEAAHANAHDELTRESFSKNEILLAERIAASYADIRVLSEREIEEASERRDMAHRKELSEAESATAYYKARRGIEQAEKEELLILRRVAARMGWPKE